MGLQNNQGTAVDKKSFSRFGDVMQPEMCYAMTHDRRPVVLVPRNAASAHRTGPPSEANTGR